MVAGPRNQFVIDKAGIQDSGLFRAAADGPFIGSHGVSRKLFSPCALHCSRQRYFVRETGINTNINGLCGKDVALLHPVLAARRSSDPWGRHTLLTFNAGITDYPTRS